MNIISPLLCYRCLNHECEHPGKHRQTPEGQTPPRPADTIYDGDAICAGCLHHLRATP